VGWWVWVVVGVATVPQAQVRALERAGLLIQHATHIRHIVCGLSGAPPSFWTLSHKWHDFRKKVSQCKMCVFMFPSTLI
jgi:hypothetical protein